MPITADQIAPLMRETYTDADAAWDAIVRVVRPLAEPVRRLCPRGASTAPEEFVDDVITNFTVKVIEHRGLEVDARPDYTPWLRTSLLNQARDLARPLLRALARHVDHDPEREIGEASPPPDSAEDAAEALRDPGVAQRLARLEREQPLRAVGLYAAVAPSRLVRSLLEHAKATPPRGRKGAVTGLARTVDATLWLLAAHRRALAGGFERDLAAKDRFAWILRSDVDDFERWARDRKAVVAARETLGTWKDRAEATLDEWRTGRASKERA